MYPQAFKPAESKHAKLVAERCMYNWCIELSCIATHFPCAIKCSSQHRPISMLVDRCLVCAGQTHEGMIKSGARKLRRL